MRKSLVAIMTGVLLFGGAPALIGETVTTATITSAEFNSLMPAGTAIERLATGLRFTEGPVWIGGADGYLLFSDIPASKIYRWSEKSGLSVYREDSHQANGNNLDRAGRLITCEHASRTVTRTEPDGAITTLASTYDGKRLNSPNDLVTRADGTIYFTDPPYGLRGPDYVGKEQPANYVFRLEPDTGKLTVLASDFDMPNGLCFSPDEKKLYIADSGKPKHIRVFDVNPDGTLGNGKVFCTIDKGAPDGIRVDAEGRLYSTAGDGVQVFSPAGELLGRIPIPESPANLCWGDAGHSLYITARTSLYRVRLK